MKIGLLTYHHSRNYGAVLQSYATARKLEELGHTVTFINLQQYEPKKLGQILFYPKNRAFDKFMETYYPGETEFIASYSQLKSIHLDFDALVVGSDQTWNPLISKNDCLAYFLDFGSEKMLRLSYASSFGLHEWPSEGVDTSAVASALGKFNGLSVRESSGQDILEKTFGLKSTLVVDPTLLLDSYDEISGPIEDNGRVICYLLRRTPVELQVARAAAASLGDKPTIISNIYPFKGFKYIYPPSIEDWIRLIGGARCVVTDSFHGLVFSLIYHRQFVVVTDDVRRNGRLKDLLSLVGLENRYFSTLEEFEESDVLQQEIDYERVDQILARHRSTSIEFLKHYLNGNI